ncbi:MAG: hypothetical protein KC489_01835 [Gemmatimonadetes bacterium]|nr:hypothetical protein [Gemmatimonadota bacterium]
MISSVTMAKLAIVFAIFLVQVQPLAGAALCQRHYQAMDHACSMTAAEHDGMVHESGTAPAEHECTQLAACALPSLAIVPGHATLDPHPELAVTVPGQPSDLAPQAAQRPPFHPPRA